MMKLAFFVFQRKEGCTKKEKTMKRKAEVNIIRYFDALTGISENFIVKE